MKRLVALLLPLAIIGCLVARQVLIKRGEKVKAAEQMAARSQAAPQVATATAQRRSIVNTFEATGVLESPLSVKITPKVTGRIDFIEVQEGDPVRRGQVLVRIDPTEIEAQVRQQEAALAEAQFRLAQAQATQSSVAVSVESQISQQKAALAVAEAEYDQVRENAAAQIAAADAEVADMQARVDSAGAGIGNTKAAIIGAQATLANSKTKQERLANLLARGGASRQETDDAAAAVSVGQAAVEVAQGQLQAATASRESAIAQKRAAEQQAKIIRKKTAADVEAARQRVIQARALLSTASANTSQKSAYRQSLAALGASVEMARAAVASAKAKRADTVLIAPMDGAVTERKADPGSLATSGSPLLSIESFRQIWVSVSVPDTIRGLVQMGTEVAVRFDAVPDQAFTASVVQISPSADPEARQFAIRATLDNSENFFKPGMFAHVSIETLREEQVVTVPREAVQTDERGSFAMVVVADSVQRRDVRTGASDDGHIAITEGLNAGDTVVTMSSRRLKEGQKVSTGEGEGRGRPGASEGPHGERGSMRQATPSNG